MSDTEKHHMVQNQGAQWLLIEELSDAVKDLSMRVKALESKR